MVEASGQERFKTTKWNAVALWAWSTLKYSHLFYVCLDHEVENCAICRNMIWEPCLECQAS